MFVQMFKVHSPATPWTCRRPCSAPSTTCPPRTVSVLASPLKVGDIGMRRCCHLENTFHIDDKCLTSCSTSSVCRREAMETQASTARSLTESCMVHFQLLLQKMFGDWLLRHQTCKLAIKIPDRQEYCRSNSNQMYKDINCTVEKSCVVLWFQTDKYNIQI